MMNKNNFLSANRIYMMVVFLILLAVVSSYAVVHQLWHLPFLELFIPSFELSLSDMSIQLQILPTMLVALTAGGLLGLVSVLLQQLVKNTLASDTTLAVGSGANIALLIVTLFLPSLALGGSFWVAFVGALGVHHADHDHNRHIDNHCDQYLNRISIHNDFSVTNNTKEKAS